MATFQYIRYPASPSVTGNASVGANGSAIPLASTLVGGENPSGNMMPLQTDSSGNLKVSLSADPVDPLDVNLADVGGAAVSLGQKTASVSIPVILASDQGNSTSALQSTGNTSLASIDGKTPALGQALAAASVPVVLTAAQITTLTPLSTLTANQGSANATPWNMNMSQYGGSVTSLGAKNSAASMPVVIASDQSAVPISGTVAVTGVATAANQTNASQKSQIVDGSGSVIGSTSNALNVFSTNPGSAPIGNIPLQFIRNVYSTTNVTTSAYVQLIASTSGITNVIETFDTSGQTLEIAFGASGSEVNKFLIFPGGNGRNTCAIPSGTRISIRAVSATASSGEFDLTLYT